MGEGEVTAAASALVLPALSLHFTYLSSVSHSSSLGLTQAAAAVKVPSLDSKGQHGVACSPHARAHLAVSCRACEGPNQHSSVASSASATHPGTGHPGAAPPCPCTSASTAQPWCGVTVLWLALWSYGYTVYIYGHTIPHTCKYTHIAIPHTLSIQTVIYHSCSAHMRLLTSLTLH